MPPAMLHSAGEWVARFGARGGRSVVTIGNFDGMHLGHQEILRGVVERARRTGRMAAVLTFFPHPARVLRPAQCPPLIQTLDQRLDGFATMGIDAALVLRFNTALSKLRAGDFTRRFLADAMRAEHVLVGGNFRFGYRKQGNVEMLADFGARFDFDVQVAPPVMLDGIVVSSSAVRRAVSGGRVEDAAKMLGRPFSLAGQIQKGSGMGRKLVVPTLNLATEQELLPKTGVYATETAARGNVYRSVTNVGVRPTFDGERLTIESHLLDFNEDWPGGSIEVRFLKRLRDERKFPGPEALRAQILADIDTARSYFEKGRS